MKMKKLIYTLVSVLICAVSLFVVSCSGERNVLHEHILGEPSVVAPADCYSDGAVAYKCKNCDFIKIETVPKLQHEYVVIQTVPATCFSQGSIVNECKNCGNQVLEHIDKIDHAITGAEHAADCLHGGYVELSCENCDYRSLEVTSNALDHDVQFVRTVRTECGMPYVDIFECKRCSGLKSSESDKISEHVYEIIEDIAASCTHGGSLVEKCVYCGDIVSNETPSVSHNLVTDKIASTCIREGQLIKYCTNSNCGFSEVVMKLPVSSHKMSVMNDCKIKVYYSLDGGYIYSDEQCTQALTLASCVRYKGDKHFKCDVCSLSVDGDEHEVVVENTSTCIKDGLLIEKCKNCGEVFDSSIAFASGHTALNVEYFCIEDKNLTALYLATGGEPGVKISYRCTTCSEFIKTTDHKPSCDDDMVTCVNPQVCIDCKETLLWKSHIAPQLTCVSPKNDGKYYCVVCNVTALSAITPHNFIEVGNTAATCAENATCLTQCVCGESQVKVIANSAFGHVVPDMLIPCKTNAALTLEYYNLNGVQKNIAYKCNRCDEYIGTVDHRYNCDVNDVACNNPMYCLSCKEVFLQVEHVAPSYTCVSIKGDNNYYCANCNEFAMGELTEHNYTIESITERATCTQNARTLLICVCGAENTDGYIERPNTMLGHSIGKFASIDKYDCKLGHVLRCPEYACKNGCGLDFSAEMFDDNLVYCLDLYKYFANNGMLDDLLYDEAEKKLSDNRLCTLLSCCSNNNYRYESVEHAFSNEPFTTENYILNGVEYFYQQATCFTKGSAVFACVHCEKPEYIPQSIDLDVGNHEFELLPCGEHCKSCAPENASCFFAFTINVYDSDGNEFYSFGLPVSQTYPEAFLFNEEEKRLIEERDPSTGEVYYRLSDSFIADLNSNGPCYATQEAAKNYDASNLIDWYSVKLYRNRNNVVSYFVDDNRV